ncbi:hypothetical protein DM02DRAFT_617157 [Periconia macrospinosa]|uniref:HAUS augmin-like complex subunit 3 N-terminal domain-containing protein n=1 Tax=Periconia macrospinosa TaxID=97972 RepID=A0A2V1DH78_9PLEO|nr:hypothetical protein DM02DRAFT_617157 [Periconia macrospinosa]
MAEEQAAHHLLNVLEERGLDRALDLDSVLAAFEDDNIKQEAAEWVNEYLQEDTLLTKEELELYQTLKKKGLLHQYQGDNQPIRPILDHELASAIGSLKSSTAAIEEQCKILEAQKSALLKLKALEKPNLDVEHLRNEERRKQKKEKARLDTAIGDISTTVQEQLTDAQREIDGEKTTLKNYLADRLASDDQILSRLPGIVSQIVTEPESSKDDKSVEQWFKAIISYRTAEVKAKVETVYLESLSNCTPDDLPDATEEELLAQKEALQAELDDLHSEIASVTEMVLEHELRKPLMELKQRQETERIQARGAWFNYVLTTLEYMAKRLDTVTAYTEAVDQFQQAITHVKKAATKSIPDPTPVIETPRLTRRVTSGSISAFTPAHLLKPPKSMDLPPALQDALRHINIPVNHETMDSLLDALSKAQIERTTKLREHHDSNVSSTHTALAQRASRADRELRTMTKSLYVHSPFRGVHLADPRLEGELFGLERDLEAASEQLLVAETNELSLNDAKVRAFVAKYGR